MSSNGFQSEAVGSEWNPAGTGSESIRTGSEPVGVEPGPGRIGGISVKEAAAHLGMPPSTMYDWVNRHWVQTIVGLSERGKEQKLIPWTEIERLQAGAKERLLQESGHKPPTGSDSGPVGGESEPASADPHPATRDSEPTGIRAESAGFDWKWVAKAEARRVRDLTTRVRFMEAHLAKAEERAEKAEERAEREGRELRLLIAQSVNAQQQTAAALTGIEERMALPAPKKTPWWLPWRR